MHILIFEPRTVGHHLSWLRYIAEDFLSDGHHLTLAIDGRPAARRLYQDNLEDILGKVDRLSIYDERGRLLGRNLTSTIAGCLTRSGARHVFINNLDDIASDVLRRAAIGRMPPKVLKTKISGVYFRPRFLANAVWPVGNIIKLLGFRRLIGGGWFRRIFLLDEYICRQHFEKWPNPVLSFLPDTWSGDFSMKKDAARRQLGIPADKFVFLHYGIGTRRKGLHLVSRILSESSDHRHWHLLCAGKIDRDTGILNAISKLEEKERVTVLNRYVSKMEEQLCFAASDVVLLPYVRHFGSSGVLALAAAANKPVVASDNGLIAKRVKEWNLGICFPSENIVELDKAMQRVQQVLSNNSEAFLKPTQRFAVYCNRAAFRNAIQSTYSSGQ